MATIDSPFLVDTDEIPSKQTLLKVASFIAGIFSLEYVFYIVAAPIIHRWGKPLDISLVTPWIGCIIDQYDGIEVPVMTVTMVICVGLACYGARRIGAGAWFSSLIVQILFIAAALFIALRVLVSAFALSLNLMSLIMAAELVAGAYGMAYFISDRNIPFRIKITTVLLALFCTTILTLFNRDQGWGDYSYLIGPARKLLQGESPDSFYMQYPLSMIVLFVPMVLLKLRLHEMQVVMCALFFLWVLLYMRLAFYCIKDRFLICSFIIALYLFRFFTVMGDMTGCPQTSPIRLDLWALLWFITIRFGLASWQSAFAFFCTFAFDNFFGLLYGILYCVVLYVKAVKERSAAASSRYKGFIMACIALCGGAAYNFLVFGSLFSKSAQFYSRFHIGFMPIANLSLFWPLLLALLISIGCIALVKKQNGHYLLLFGFVVIQSVYFLGRSHDNNLLNLSGIFLMVIFIAIDSLQVQGSYRRLMRGAVMGLIFTGCVLGSSQIIIKGGNILNHCKKGKLVVPSDLDVLVKYCEPSIRDPKKTVIVNLADAYYNYRLNLPQTGDIVPFYAYIFLDDAAKHLVRLLSDNYTVLVLPIDAKRNIESLNQSHWLRQSHRKFFFEGDKYVWKLKLVPE